MNSFFKKMWWLQKAFFHLRNIHMRTLILKTMLPHVFFIQTQVSEILSFDSLGYI